MEQQEDRYRPKIADESVWLGQNFFDDEVLEKRFSPAAALNPGIKHIAFETENEDLRWLEESSNLGLLYHATFHSIFLKWAVAGNGLHVAAEKYNGWKEGQAFRIAGYRCDGKVIVPVSLHEYPGNIASQLHTEAGQILAGWGFCSLYSGIEEMLFLLFKLYYVHDPKNLLQGDEQKPLKALYGKRGDDEASKEAWESAFAERFDQWRLKKGYKGIENNFSNYVDVTKLDSRFASVVPVENWGKTLNIVSEIRNCFVHGAKTVSPKLAGLCATPEAFGFSFTEGEAFRIDMNDLAILEMFLDEFTSMLNHAFHDTYAKACGLDLKTVFNDKKS